MIEDGLVVKSLTSVLQLCAHEKHAQSGSEAERAVSLDAISNMKDRLEKLEEKLEQLNENQAQIISQLDFLCQHV